MSSPIKGAALPGAANFKGKQHDPLFSSSSYNQHASHTMQSRVNHGLEAESSGVRGLLSEEFRDKRPEPPAKFDTERLKKAFDVCDLDMSGILTKDKIRHILALLGHALDDETTIDTMLEMADCDGDGQVTWDDFATLFWNPARALERADAREARAKQKQEEIEKQQRKMRDQQQEWIVAVQEEKMPDTEENKLLGLFTQLTGSASIRPGDLKHMFKLFKDADTDNSGELELDEFMRMFPGEDAALIQRMFDLFDTDGSGSIELKEFIIGLSSLSSVSTVDKVKLAFNLYDLDNSGFLDYGELLQLLTAAQAGVGKIKEADVRARVAICSFDFVRCKMARQAKEVYSKLGILANEASQGDDEMYPPLSFDQFISLARESPQLLLPAHAITQRATAHKQAQTAMPAGDPPKSSKDFNTAPTGDNKKQQSKPRAANQGSNPGGSSRNISRAQEVSALVAQQATRNVQSSTVMHSRILQREIDERRVWEELKASIRRSLAALSEASSGDSVVTFGGRKLIVVVCWLPISLDWDSDSSNITGHHDDPSGCEYAKSLIAPAKPALRCRSVVIVGSVKIRDVKSDQWLDEPYSDDMQTAVREYLDPLGYRAVMTPSDRSRGLLPNDFADSIIFRLFHYLTPPPPETGFHSTQDWASYVDVNTVYSDTIAELYQTGDVVSVHGYSLMLVPEILRKQRNLNEMFIGFHFHTVFPSSEIYRCFPQRAQLLRGVLSADIISLQSFQYARHFFMACTRVLGVECTASSGIIEPSEETGGTRTKVVSIPMGINPLPLRALQQKPEVIEHVKSMRETFANKKIILGIDKLNGRRGIPHKLLAFHKLLTRKPELRSKCVWIEVCDPTGTGESEQDLLKQVYQIAGEINGSFGTFESVPVHLLIQPFDMSELVPLYEVADVIVDTSLRDVMATSACEYLACNHKDGVLVLSEFSGSATSLRAAATTVNPWDITRFSEGIYDALTMDDEERIERHCYGANHVSRHTEAEWGRRLLQEFADAREEAETQKTWMIPEKLGQDDVVSSIRSSARVLIVTGYQGTLGARPSAELRVLPERRVTPVSDYELQTLESLGHDEMTDVVVVSSLSRHDLGAAGLVSDLPINVLAENGAWLRTPGSDWVCTVEPDVDISWLPAVQSIMEYFVDRTPGSYIDRTDFSVAWHYPKSGSQASGDHCETQTRDMMIHLWAGPLCSTAADIVVGNNSLEVRAVSVNKAEKLDAVLQSWGRTYDTVLVLGDFIARDEDIYTVVNKYATSAVLRKESDLSVDSTGLSGGSTLSDMDHEGSTNPEFNPGVFACTVGKHGTRAAYHLADCHDVAFLLAKCAWALANRTSSPIATSATGKEEEALDARDEADEELPRTATISAHP